MLHRCRRELPGLAHTRPGGNGLRGTKTQGTNGWGGERDTREAKASEGKSLAVQGSIGNLDKRF